MAIRFLMSRRILAGLCALILAGFPPQARGYSVLTHEAIIDIFWLDTIQPVLLKRFPGATEEQLKQAHAYAYGWFGAIPSSESTGHIDYHRTVYTWTYAPGY
jgi:hypothetical protein